MGLSNFLAKLWKRPLAAAIPLAVLLLTIAACGDDADIDLSVVYDTMLGGDTTAFSSGTNAFELSARNLTNDLRRTFEIGDSFFTQNWVTAPPPQKQETASAPRSTLYPARLAIAMTAGRSLPTVPTIRSEDCCSG